MELLENNTGHCNKDGDQLYDRPTVIQLIQTDRECTDIWGYMDLGGYRCMGPYDIWRAYGCRGCTDVGAYDCRGCMDKQMAYRHGGIWTMEAYRCRELYGHREVNGWRGHTDMRVSGCMGCMDVWGHMDILREYRHIGAYGPGGLWMCEGCTDVSEMYSGHTDV